MKENNLLKDLESKRIKLASTDVEENCLCSNYDVATNRCINTGNYCDSCFSVKFF